ncbi:putative neural-cadherin 2 [Portunus trituberculatus]|uniref:Putative neural-cadherin 2 n=1 Tax=Portunus trituberculatus TaxID=210409 RepID=A0A5B7D4V5_PORTR|nr:putative neural-cadherin 2 [Portunus trituberculatus]
MATGERIEFSIKEGNEQGFFSVDSTSGLLSLVQHLDYEEQDQYELVVQATVGESSSEATVLVRVTDQNDHAPAFPRTLHETQITEEDDRHLPKTILTDVTPITTLLQLQLLVLTIVGVRNVYCSVSDLLHNVPHVINVVEGSGRGSTMFSVRSRPNGEAAGDLRALVPLDYEDPEHRQGFRFQVQVTDMRAWLQPYVPAAQM